MLQTSAGVVVCVSKKLTFATDMNFPARNMLVFSSPVQCTQTSRVESHNDRQTDRQTDDTMMPITEIILCTSTIG